MRAEVRSLRDLGVEEARDAMLASGNRAKALDVIKTLTRDPVYTQIIMDSIESGRLDLRLVIGWLSEMIQPKVYLEIGVRRGFSMSAVVSRCPNVEVFGFDMWVKQYAGVGNPGPALVRRELRRVGHRGNLVLIGGDSHQTLPKFFGDLPYSIWDRLLRRAYHAPDLGFDLILVDGDHSIEGAYADLKQVIGHLRVGGVLVFDDITPNLAQLTVADLRAFHRELGPDPHNRGGLHGVWRAIQREYPNFKYFEFAEDSPGVAFAIRIE
ncbi:MAG: class I SAM-dependent methyltransferase [Coriobacteriia bacterium]